MRTLMIPQNINKLSPQELYEDAFLEHEIAVEEFDSAEKEFNADENKETATRLAHARAAVNRWKDLKNYYFRQTDEAKDILRKQNQELIEELTRYAESL